MGVMGVGCGETATSTSPTSVDTQPSSFSTLLYPGGSVSRGVAMDQAGTLSVTLSSLTPPGARLGIGIGVPYGGAPCAATYVTRVAPSANPALSVPVDAGSYCVVAFSLAETDGEATGFVIAITTTVS